MDNQLNQFTKMHDEFIVNWNKAMISGDTSSLERMTEDYYVAFFKGVNEKPIIFNRKEAIVECGSLLSNYRELRRSSKIGLFV